MKPIWTKQDWTSSNHSLMMPIFNVSLSFPRIQTDKTAWKHKCPLSYLSLSLCVWGTQSCSCLIFIKTSFAADLEVNSQFMIKVRKCRGGWRSQTMHACVSSLRLYGHMEVISWELGLQTWRKHRSEFGYRVWWRKERDTSSNWWESCVCLSHNTSPRVRKPRRDSQTGRVFIKTGEASVLLLSSGAGNTEQLHVMMNELQLDTTPTFQ